MSWVLTSICFDKTLFFTPGLFLLLAVLFFGTKELRASKISEFAAEFSDGEVVSLNEVKGNQDVPVEQPGFVAKVF